MKYFVIAFLFLLTGAQAGAQTSAQTASAENSLLWEVSGNGLKAPSYLFGTYHLIGKSFLDTLPAVIQHLERSKAVVGELIMEDEMVMAQKMMPLMMLQGNTLDKIFSDAEYKEIDVFIQAKTGNAISLTMLNSFKPAAVQLTLVSFLAPKDISADNPALDMYLQQAARERQKEVKAFETLEEQASLLFNIPIERQKELLLKTVRESDRMIKESAEMFQHYKQQNTTALAAAIKDSRDFSLEEMNTLLINRNKAWIKKLPEMMVENPAFIAVGAGHLLGADGLISLLRQQGYQVKALPLK